MRDNPPVCPSCGTKVGDAPECPSCRTDLRYVGKLPLRSDWELDQRAARADAADSEAPTVQFEMNPAALVVALLGAGAIIIALFLPANENAGFSSVQSNTLIQQGAIVWSVVVFGALFALGLALSYQRRVRPTWWGLLFPVSVAATTARLLGGATLYPVVNGRPDTSLRGVHAGAGSGVYAALAGAVICAAGVLAMRLSPGRNLRRCPLCAETVLAEARVCRYCGQRLEEPENDESPRRPKSTGASVNI